jgi:ATP-dependent exoDNAse (exonuclease V) beta subunit
MSGTDPLLGDREARELAVTEFERPIALDAGAGTGKTRALVSRLATWLLGPGWDQAASELQSGQTPGGGPCAGAQELTHSTAMAAVGGAVAITFTEAATAEMARRLAGVIGALANGEPAKDLSPLPRALAALDTGALRDRARALAPLLARLEIQTIHGFCFRLISTHPFDAGLHPAATVDADGARLAEVATRVLLARLREHDPRLVALLAVGVEPVGLLEALSGLVERGVRPAELAAVRFDAATADRILSSLAGELEPLRDPFRRLAAGARRSTTLPPALALIDEVAAELAKEGGEDSLVLLNRIAARVRDEEEAWKKPFAAWRREGLNQGQSNVPGIDAEVFLRQAERVRAQLESVAALQPVLFEAARRAFAPLLEEVRTRLQREGVLSYDELLVRAVGLLEGRPALRRRLRREIRQLLVDEFQDTDRRQCRLLELLALGDDDGPRPGLFVVGDPKQSIYSWRSADLAAYEAFLAGMEAAGGVRRSLAVNFRSRPRLLAEVERLIRPAMQPSAGLQPPYEALLAFREDADAISAGRDRVEHWVSWPEESRGAEARVTSAAATACEARAIAEDIADLARAGHRFSSFALLLRTRGDLEIYLEALRGAGVPYAVEKDRSYYRRREVIDLACAVRAILDPADLLALVAFLRSPLVGVPDAAWIPLWRGGFATALADLGGDDAEAGPELAAIERIVLRAADEIPADVPGLAALSGWPQALLAAVGDLARLRREFARLPAAAWLERLRARLLPEPLAAARFLGRFGLANVRRLLARLERELAATADPHRVLAGLRRGIEEEIEAEDARPPEVDADAVKVMTIHSAKGLEFDQVYLAQLHKLPRRETGLPEFDVAAEEAGGAPSRELVLFGAPSPGWAAADERRRRSRRAESVAEKTQAARPRKRRNVPRPHGGSAARRSGGLPVARAHRRRKRRSLASRGLPGRPRAGGTGSSSSAAHSPRHRLRRHPDGGARALSPLPSAAGELARERSRDRTLPARRERQVARGRSGDRQRRAPGPGDRPGGDELRRTMAGARHGGAPGRPRGARCRRESSPRAGARPAALQHHVGASAGARGGDRGSRAAGPALLPDASRARGTGKSSHAGAAGRRLGRPRPALPRSGERRVGRRRLQDRRSRRRRRGPRCQGGALPPPARALRPRRPGGAGPRSPATPRALVRRRGSHHRNRQLTISHPLPSSADDFVSTVRRRLTISHPLSVVG